MSEDKREAIFNAAVELFAERGYYGASVPLIVERAGVGTGTIYRYFKDKEDLVNELYRHWKTTMIRAVMDDLPLELPLRALFHEVWRRFVDFALEHPAVFTFVEAHHHAPYLDQCSLDLNENLNETTKFFFERGLAEQVIKDVPPELAVGLIMGSLKEIMKLHWSGQVRLTPKIRDQMEEMCWEAIRR